MNILTKFIGGVFMLIAALLVLMGLPTIAYLFLDMPFNDAIESWLKVLGLFFIGACGTLGVTLLCMFGFILIKGDK